MSTVELTAAADHQWWQEATVYQIYPKSFFDTDGDGIGDLQGITAKVDYLDSLGVDAVWLCPVYDSPQADNGYDIRDYRSIHDRYGDIDDWKRLRDALHDRDIRLVMDLVVNHTSDEHEWFQRSRRRDGAYADYYYWRDGRPAADTEYETDDGPADEVAPNNWTSFFGGPAWSYDETRGQWYLHLFDEKQPDLNWEYEPVREAVYEMMRWWIDQGIDGFRMDVINLVSKTPGLPDGDPDGGLVGAEHFMNGPKVHEYLSELVDRVIPGPEFLTIGETPGATIEDARQFIGEDGDGLSMVFQFEHVTFDHDDHKWDAGDWSLVEFKEILSAWQNGLTDDGWNSIYLNNHDQPRMVSRFGDDGEYRQKSGKLLATLTHTLRGTPFVYQGEELGMTNASFASPDELRDIEARNYVEAALEEGDAESYDDVRDAIEYVSRDNARTPMQWDATEHAGFTDGEPWIDCNSNYETVNADRGRANQHSVWHYYRDLIELRAEHDVLVYGDFDLLYPEDPDVFAYTRTLGDEQSLVVLNFEDEPVSFDVPDEIAVSQLELAIANSDVQDPLRPTFELSPYEARVYLSE